MFCQAFERQTDALKHILMKLDFSIIRYLFEVNSEMTHHLLLFTDLTASKLPQDVPSVSLKQFHVGTSSRQFQR